MNDTTRILAAAACVLALAGCGGGKTTTTTTTTNVSPGSMGRTEAQREAAALPVGAMAPVDVNCGAVKPVWVNLHTKAYHEAGDPYYGRTKNGKYMCPNAAKDAGFHPAGSRMNSSSMNSNGDTSGAYGSDSSMTSNSGGTRHHHHRETMVPMATPTP